MENSNQNKAQNNIKPLNTPSRQQEIAKSKKEKFKENLETFEKVAMMVSEDSVMSEYEADQKKILNLKPDNSDNSLQENNGISGLMKPNDVEPYSTEGAIPYHKMSKFLRTELIEYGISPEVDQFCNTHYMFGKLIAISYIADKPKFELKGYKYVVFVSFGVSEEGNLRPKSFGCYVSENSSKGYFNGANEGKTEKNSNDKKLFASANLMNKHNPVLTKESVKELGNKISDYDILNIKLD